MALELMGNVLAPSVFAPQGLRLLRRPCEARLASETRRDFIKLALGYTGSCRHISSSTQTTQSVTREKAGLVTCLVGIGACAVERISGILFATIEIFDQPPLRAYHDLHSLF
ncbi:hypothetical protein PCASD_02993 [Puccinia coronata f. sp. avenae]|uniref:Uncharacterized protein n=1 Tax=Puccinia coronata f. sp. avenae TaxID=200324 RepID=A0A2N5VGJ7_9BASI|nr:hypothetical protein PCASD_13288 [Puccinia coronata f. sp. avenae]PLW49119.1 hypothetical protein PCASD_02993 [Puccinia coronata f. sp. avenae]